MDIRYTGVKNDETDKGDPRPAGRGLYNRI